MENEYLFSDLDQYLFGHASHYDLYRKLGAHPTNVDGVDGTYFAVWAPNAQRVSVIGEFNDWDTEANVISNENEIGVWQGFIPNAKVGQMYKYFIIGYQGEHLYKADPFANQAELRPGTASVISDLRNLKWSDEAWMKKRQKFDIQKEPMVIYECHIGSWMKHPESAGRGKEGFYNYREFAEKAADYIKDMGYTHIELMGCAEHPFDGSWGYQVTGYYAPTSRYGTPNDFQYMINYFHKKGIGVILDWVPAHFPKDAAGLACFDGTELYEHKDPRQGEHPDWGTKIFNYGRPEVKNFLLANALFWVEFFHVDGLRVDAVASMLYLDYGKKDGEWVANKYGENKNLEAIEFFKHLNSCLLGRNKGAVMVAEESTAWPKVTADVDDDGLGFSMKWNMGWMNDFLEYMKLDPLFRKDNHYKMTFSTSYAYSENYILVISHDEVVHLKCSMWSKMPGIYEDKFHNLRAGYTYMLGHPGKKLLFMGQEFGQQREWSEEREIDWFLLETDLNKQLQDYVRDLWKMYAKYQCLHGTDYDPQGFDWINADDKDRSIYSFMRKSSDGKKNLVFVMNMTPMARPDYRCGVPVPGNYKLVMNSMDPKYGGNAERTKKVYKAEKGEWDRRPYSIAYDLPAYGCAIFEFDYVTEEEIEKEEKAPAAKKTAAKKPAAKKTAAKKPAEKKTTAKKTAAKKTEEAAAPAAAEAAEVKAEAKPAEEKKAPAKKPAAKKTAAKKPAAKKTAKAETDEAEAPKKTTRKRTTKKDAEK